MTLRSGTKIGPYEIVAAIGAGGMGEVYRARDTRLGRDVAVKVLPASLSANADRLRRFEQEACAAGTLNHPNILVIHHIDTHDGSPYIVSELLDGETLRERISGTPLAQRRAIDYASQIARGLAAAHEKGIVHRDLKPDNIFVTKDGRLKILDFGLAKLTQVDGSHSQSEIPTRRVDTGPGVVMGTVGYMSPEQVRGKPIDNRSDIFSFGAILYEMLSGRRAFRGESTADTMSAILKEDPPDLSATNQNVSPALERLVNHCLEKNPESRFHSASDLAFALEAISTAAPVSSQTVTAVAAPSGRERIIKFAPWIAAAIFALAFLVTLLSYVRRSPSSEPAAINTRFLIPPPEKATFLDAPLISPDGHRVVVRTRDASGKISLWMRPLDSLEAQPLAGTESGRWPFWSPDSRSIGFFAAGKLKKLDVSGGPAQTLGDAPLAVGGTWNRDGTIIFGRNPGECLFRIPATGGTPTPATVFDKSSNELAEGWPYFLPDGRHFLYGARYVQQEKTGIYVGSLDSKETRFLFNTGSAVAYAPPGYLLFVRDGILMAQAFNPERLQLNGGAVVVVEQVDFDQDFALGMFSVSQTGVLVYSSAKSFQNTQLVWFDRTGKQIGTVGEPARYGDIRLSPDGKHVALLRSDTDSGKHDIWSIELTRDIFSRLTLDPTGANSPLWSPDGSRIAFSSRTEGGAFSLYQKFASRMGEDELLLNWPKPILACDWSPDGRYILFRTQPREKGSPLWLVPLFGERKPEPFWPTDFDEENGRFSPDGRWIAYASNESGKFQIYVRSFPASSAAWQISNDGGGHPRWRRDGKELFYVSPDKKLMAVEVNESAGTFEVGLTKPLFEIGIVSEPSPSNYDVTADGQRFLVNTNVEKNVPVTVVMNWTAKLKE
jgi:serine/threonine protein kinase/Tol biopolymer transport system component